MPSRLLRSPSPSPSPSSANHHRNLPPTAALSTSAAFSFILIFLLCLRKLTRKRTSPETPSTPPYRLPYSALRRATDHFSPARRLGQGGFGPVFRGSPIPKLTGEIAVKVMDSGSIQGEREFQNEVLFASSVSESPYIVSLLGFSSDRKRRRMLLVYELMLNGNLQDALLHRKCSELMEWKRRFSVAVDVARGLEYLHGLEKPIVHGDIKPSNVLLDLSFSAKIGDFGLARLKFDLNSQIEVAVEGNHGSGGTVEDYGSVAEETESVATAFEDSNLAFEFSPDPAAATASASTTPSPELLSGGGVKEYVIDWIGTEVNSERPKSGWEEETVAEKNKKKKNRKQLDWWISMDEETEDKKLKKKNKEKRRPPAREWWKEEYCDELTKKKKKKNKNKNTDSNPDREEYLPRDEEMYAEKKKRNRSHSRSSLDWWLTGGSHDSAGSGGGYSSTPSMRGTVCYIAPETGFGENPSEKCDVYSYGVTLLVLIAGRRPLQVTNSPASEYHRANLLSWARRLARAGKLVELIDKNLRSLDTEQAVLCITVALLCLQKIPARRPTMKEVVSMLTAESEPPKLPDFLSPSPLKQSRFPYKSSKKPR